MAGDGCQARKGPGGGPTKPKSPYQTFRCSSNSARPDWGIATLRDKMGHCLHGFFTSATRASAPSPQKREHDPSNHEVPCSTESAKDRLLLRVLPASALAVGSPALRTVVGVAA